MGFLNKSCQLGWLQEQGMDHLRLFKHFLLPALGSMLVSCRLGCRT